MTTGAAVGAAAAAAQGSYLTVIRKLYFVLCSYDKKAGSNSDMSENDPAKLLL